MAQESSSTESKCSQYGEDEQNLRTCQNEGKRLRLFGTDIMTEEDLKRAASITNFESQNKNVLKEHEHEASYNGYGLDSRLVRYQRSQISKKRTKGTGFPWTEEEHSRFLEGLKKVGKGNWKKISEDYVKTRSLTQVASHAQKYFLRISYSRKHRARVFEKTLIKNMNTTQTRDTNTTQAQDTNTIQAQTQNTTENTAQVVDQSLSRHVATPQVYWRHTVYRMQAIPWVSVKFMPVIMHLPNIQSTRQEH